jgi:hypothetical protein
MAITSLFETHPTVRDLDRSGAFDRDIVGLQPAAHDAVLGAASSGSEPRTGDARTGRPERRRSPYRSTSRSLRPLTSSSTRHAA